MRPEPEDRLERVFRDTLELLTPEQRLRVWEIRLLDPDERREQVREPLPPDPRFVRRILTRPREKFAMKLAAWRAADPATRGRRPRY